MKFLVHFIGDIHQPLHCAERNGDRGGNKRLVFFREQQKAVRLHTVWDTLVLPANKGRRSVAEYGAELNKRITDEQAKSGAAGTAVDWATESWRIARDVVYAGVPEDGDPRSWARTTSRRRDQSWMSRFRRPACGWQRR